MPSPESIRRSVDLCDKRICVPTPEIECNTLTVIKKTTNKKIRSIEKKEIDKFTKLHIKKSANFQTVLLMGNLSVESTRIT